MQMFFKDILSRIVPNLADLRIKAVIQLVEIFQYPLPSLLQYTAGYPFLLPKHLHLGHMSILPVFLHDSILQNTENRFNSFLCIL